MFVGELLFDFAIIVNLSFLRVYQQNLPRLQSSLLCNHGWVEIHYSHLRGNHHHVVFRYRVTSRAQTVAVKHSTSKSSVREQQCGRTVPRFHQDGMVFVESLQVFGDGILVVERLWYQYRHGMRQGESRHHEEFQNIVKTRRVGHPWLNDRRNVRSPESS